MITVCHIITQLELGGAQQNTLYTVTHLDRTRCHPVLITGAEGILIEDADKETAVQKYYLPELVRDICPTKDMQAVASILKILRREKRRFPESPLIVHTHSSKAGIVGRWAAKLAGADAIIHSIHGFGFHPYQSSKARRLFIALEWLTSKITTHFIAVSAANIDTGVRLKLFSRSRVSLIRSGIDIEQFRQVDNSDLEQTFAALHIPPQKKIVGMVACFKPQKAPLDFVRALKLVAESVPDVHAIMVGDGVLRPAIEAEIARCHLEDTISLLGWRTDIPALLHLCQMLVLTSLWEGLPRVCPQAMAAGIPIVATRVDGTPEAVLDGVNGFLVTPGDIETIAEKIAYLLTHPDVAKRMGVEGQQRVAEFDIHRMVRQQEDLYQSLVKIP